ncbi:hypothetical protein CRE_03356 [Caenorhabditis remanei]|uniref:Uncharacterized protein n=1 Tax=Caenorhabditis remanei TaxID=31234 RepID=E3N640_CAERE|nr:hypothetical protein CRE_03356 [Caenorhabditis remanei]
MVPYNYAAIQAVQTLQAQEAEMKRQCEEGKMHYRQEILELKPKIAERQVRVDEYNRKQETLKIVEVQERADEYNKKFVEDIKKDKVLLGNYKKSLEDHSEKLQEFVKKEYQELDEKVAETANQEGLKSELKELERLLKLRKMLRERFGVKRTQDLEEFQKAIAAQVKQADNETATSFEQAVEICGRLGHSGGADVGYGMRYL